MSATHFRHSGQVAHLDVSLGALSAVTSNATRYEGVEFHVNWGCTTLDLCEAAALELWVQLGRALHMTGKELEEGAA
jgi:hypothetical protein